MECRMKMHVQKRHLQKNFIINYIICNAKLHATKDPFRRKFLHNNN